MEEAIYEKASSLGLNPRPTPKGYSIRCPKHSDRRNSAIVFKDDGFAACLAGCGRWNFMGTYIAPREENYQVKEREDEDNLVVDYYDYWLSLSPLDEGIKGLSANVLNSLGWRKLPSNNQMGLPPGIFIPAFSPSRTSIPFAQVRHTSGDRRFSFPPRVKPLAFGMESTEKFQRYLPFTEGNSDRAVLEAAGIPAIALPSGASGRLLRSVGEWAIRQGLLLVAVSDNDAVGDKLLHSLDGTAPYVDARVEGYKDIGEMFEAEGLAAIERRYSWLRPSPSSN